QQPDPISCSLPLPYLNIALDDSLAEPLSEPKPVDTDIDSDHTHQLPTTSTEIEIRRSSRHTHRHTWMQDFECYFSDISTPALVQSVNTAHTKFVDTLNKLQEPRSCVQAMQHQAWIQAMDAEIQALEHNQTWDITPLSKDKKAIGSRWIYKLKLKPNGTVDRYKARLVAKGYTQVEGVDFFESFSPIAKVVTVRVLLALAASKNWHVHQIDVNNAFLHGPSSALIAEVKQYLDQLFTVKDLKVAKFFLGIEIARSPQGMALTQLKYTKDILADTGMTNARAATTPLPTGVKFTEEAGKPLPNAEVYRRLIGRLFYLGFTRPDISHATQQLSQFLQAPCQQHWDAALHLLRYLNGTQHKGLFFPSNSVLELKSTVSRSTAEAEYRSMGATGCELTWIYFLLKDMQLLVSLPIPFLCDNRAALYILSNPVFHERTKYLEIDCHLVRDKYKSGFLAPDHVSSKEQLADIFTKPLPGSSLHPFLEKLGLITFDPSTT
ncbi:UNVERIFIED_CONTAM: Retrovirus-related Pol polyprotein from transposon RE2, partial [Sesamum radiatum]